MKVNAFQKLVGSRDAFQTVLEINQQPKVWQETLRAVRGVRNDVAALLCPADRGSGPAPSIILAGAGSSEFVGKAIEAVLRRKLNLEVRSVATTHFVTHGGSIFLAGRDYVVVSIARSGNSPESIDTYRRVARQFPRVKQIVVTCNREGQLAQLAASDSLLIVLPPETNDKSLAMTSSFSSLALAGLSLAHLDTADEFEKLVGKASRAARHIIEDYGDALSNFASLQFSRACFLGSNGLRGCMQEGRLKMMEMTGGRVASIYDSFLGLRHGPQVFVSHDCIVVASLATNPAVRRYELDLLGELKEKRQGCGTLVICGKADSSVRRVANEVIELYPSEEPLEDDYRVLTDVVVCQILATFKSIGLGLSPDNPSPEGIINRVVQGIVIYPEESSADEPSG